MPTPGSSATVPTRPCAAPCSVSTHGRTSLHSRQRRLLRHLSRDVCAAPPPDPLRAHGIYPGRPRTGDLGAHEDELEQHPIRWRRADHARRSPEGQRYPPLRRCRTANRPALQLLHVGENRCPVDGDISLLDHRTATGFQCAARRRVHCLRCVATHPALPTPMDWLDDRGCFQPFSYPSSGRAAKNRETRANAASTVRSASATS